MDVVVAVVGGVAAVAAAASAVPPEAGVAAAQRLAPEQRQVFAEPHPPAGAAARTGTGQSFAARHGNAAAINQTAARSMARGSINSAGHSAFLTSHSANAGSMANRSALQSRSGAGKPTIRRRLQPRFWQQWIQRRRVWLRWVWLRRLWRPRPARFGLRFRLRRLRAWWVWWLRRWRLWQQLRFVSQQLWERR